MALFLHIAPCVSQTYGKAREVTLSSTEALDLYKASLHTFTLVRSGVAISDVVTGISHPISHADDAPLDDPSGERRDLAGGWYNAGDYGKWSMMTSISVSYMLHLHAIQQTKDVGDPGLLSEAKWGLSWLLKMQDDDGGVRHKVDSGPNFAWGLPPEQDRNWRLATGSSTLDTADFAAVAYQAERSFRQRDPVLAEQYRLAADRAWARLRHHPDKLASDPFYADDDGSQEIFWAQCERGISYPQHSREPLFSKLAHMRVQEVSWQDPRLLGLFSLSQSGQVEARLRNAAQRTIARSATRLVSLSRNRPFAVAMADSDYTWGSIERLLHRTALLEMASALSPGKGFERTARDQLRFCLGHNPLHVSFVTGFGQHPVRHPYHWTYMALGKLLPGWAVGGPNASALGADEPLIALQRQGTPPAKCYVDLCSTRGSWASNEGQISEEAALVFVSGFLTLLVR